MRPKAIIDALLNPQRTSLIILIPVICGVTTPYLFLHTWAFRGFTHLLSQNLSQLMPPEIYSKRNALNRTNAPSPSPVQTVDFGLRKVQIEKQRRGFAKLRKIKEDLPRQK